MPVTGIGSLPHDDPDAALDLVLRSCPALPFRFQLPALDGVMQNELRRPAETLCGWSALLRAGDAGRLDEACEVKDQLIGPVTLAALGGGPAGVTPAALHAATERVEHAALERIELLGRLERPGVLCLDEPSLPAVAARPELAERSLEAAAGLIDRLRRPDVRIGLHCCAALSPAQALRAAPDLLFFDAHRDLSRFAGHPDFAVLASSSVELAWGAIPSLEPSDPAAAAAAQPAALAGALRAALGSLPAPLRTVLLTDPWITTSCGLASVAPVRAARTFRDASALHALLTR